MINDSYLAGFFDGEGTFYLGKQEKNGIIYPKAQVLLSQSGDRGKRLLVEIQEIYGGKLYEHLKPGQHKATKFAYKLYWNKKEAIELIKVLLPHLILKKAEAEAVLQYLTRDK